MFGKVMLTNQPWQILCTCMHKRKHPIQLEYRISTKILQHSTHEHYVQDLEDECHLQPNHVGDAAMASFTYVKNIKHTIA
jgi:hypothetical protein